MAYVNNQKRAASDVKRALRHIGMTGVLLAMREHCEAEASNAHPIVQDCYGRLSQVFKDAQVKVTAISRDTDVTLEEQGSSYRSADMDITCTEVA